MKANTLYRYVVVLLLYVWTDSKQNKKRRKKEGWLLRNVYRSKQSPQCQLRLFYTIISSVPAPYCLKWSTMNGAQDTPEMHSVVEAKGEAGTFVVDIHFKLMDEEGTGSKLMDEEGTGS